MSRPSISRLLAWTLLASVLAGAREAAADLQPPEENMVCSGKKAGDACSTASVAKGRCVADTCSRLDYSKGTPPDTVSYECQRCTPASDPPASPASEAKPASKGCAIDPAIGPFAGLWALALLLLGPRRPRTGPRT